MVATMNDLLTRNGLAIKLHVHPRTIIRYEKRGMPVTYLGGALPRYDLEAVMEWQEGQRVLKGAQVALEVNQEIKKALWKTKTNL